MEQSQMLKINRQKYATPSEITSNINKDHTLKTHSVKPSSNELMNSSQNQQAFSFINSSSKQNERGNIKPNIRYGRITENSEVVKGMELERNMIDFYINHSLSLQQQVDHQLKIKNNEAQNKILNQAITDYRNIMDGYGSNKSTVYLNTNRSIKKKENEKIIKIIEQDEKQKTNNLIQVKKQLSDEMHDNDEEILSQISILQIQKFNELLENRKNIYSNDSLEPCDDKLMNKEYQQFSVKKNEINNTDRSDCERIKQALEKNYNNIQKELNIQTGDNKAQKNVEKHRVSFEVNQQLNNEKYLQIINNPNRLKAQFNLSIQLQRQIQQNIENLSNSRRKDQLQQFHKGSSPGMIESIETLRNDLSQSINKINRTNDYINSPIISFQENISNQAQEDSYHLSPLYKHSQNLTQAFILQMNKNTLQNMNELEETVINNDNQNNHIETSNFLKKRNQKVVESLIFQQKSKNNQLFPVQTYIENVCLQEQNIKSAQNGNYIYNSVDRAYYPSNRSSQIIQANYIQFKESEKQNQNTYHSSVITERKIQQEFLNKQKDLIQSKKHIEKLQNIPKQNIKVSAQNNYRIEDLKSIFTSPKDQFKNQIITPASRIQGRTTYQSYLSQQKAIQSSEEIKKLVKQKKLLADIMTNYQIQKDFTLTAFK